MPDETLQTEVDDLLELLKHQEKMAMEDAAEELDEDLDVVQNWVDFLVEERIVGVEYKFTKPYIYLNEPDEEPEEEQEPETVEEFKEEYLEQAQEKQIPEENRKGLWQQHVRKVVEGKKDYFLEEAEKRGLDDRTELWEEYKGKMLDHAA